VYGLSSMVMFSEFLLVDGVSLSFPFSEVKTYSGISLVSRCIRSLNRSANSD